MAAPAGPQAPPLIAELLARPEDFAYFQALRVLHLSRPGGFADLPDLIRRGLRFRASPSMAFPASDLVAVEPLGPPARTGPGDGGPAGSSDAPPPGQSPPPWPAPPGAASPEAAQPGEPGPDPSGAPLLHRLTVTFMGLCGAASPLPPFYSQQILDDTLDDDFNCLTLLDLISFPSFRDHAETTLHNQLPSRLLELGEPMSRHILYCLMGAGSRAVLDLMGGDLRDLAFLPLFATEARHADGLALYLSECLGLAGVEVEFLVPRTVAIPEETLCRLGTAEPEPRSLGVGAVLGRRAVDITGMFRLHIAVPDAAQFSRLMPGGALRAKLERAVDLYLTTPLRYELALSLAPGVAPRAALGRGAALGRDAVLSPEPGRPMTLHSPAGGRRAP